MSSISLHLDKPYFVAGELITGKVIITASSMIRASHLKIKWKGFERTKIRYTEPEFVHEGNVSRTVTHIRVAKDEKVFFNSKQSIGFFPGDVVNPGTYEFPLQFQLPLDLPGVFSFHDSSTTAAILYKAKVILEDSNGKDVAKDKKQIVIAPSCSRSVQPISVSNEKGFLLTKGKLKMTASLEKDIFATHEKIPIQLFIENGTKKNVVAIKVKLMQDLKVASKNHSQSTTIEVDRQVFPGVAPRSQFNNLIYFELNPNVFPSTSGALIQNKYHLDVECDVKMAIDLEVHPKITLVLMPALNQQVNLYRDLQHGCWSV